MPRAMLPGERGTMGGKVSTDVGFCLFEGYKDGALRVSQFHSLLPNLKHKSGNQGVEREKRGQSVVWVIQGFQEQNSWAGAAWYLVVQRVAVSCLIQDGCL